jgi:hypothetical protein
MASPFSLFPLQCSSTMHSGGSASSWMIPAQCLISLPVPASIVWLRSPKGFLYFHIPGSPSWLWLRTALRLRGCPSHMGLRTVVHVTPRGRHSLMCVRACIRNLRSVTQGWNSQACSLHSSVVRMGLPSMGSAEVIPMTDPFLFHDLVPHNLNSFYWEWVLINLLNFIHVSNSATWNIPNMRLFTEVGGYWLYREGLLWIW